MSVISIITINYNDGPGLESTIQSVIGQTFRDYEHVIIDGNSSDNSTDIIESYAPHLNYWISEPDAGVYQAMNKGIRASTGDYLLFLNSGDVLQDTEVLQDMAYVMNDNLDLYYGDLLFVGNGESRLQTYPEELTFSYFKNRSLGHPACFIKRELFQRVFLYNENLKIASDWEFFICAVCKFNASYKHISKTIAKFDTGGISSKDSYKQLIKTEQKAVLEKHFGFYLTEQEEFESALRKFENPPYSSITQLLKNRVSRFLTIRILKTLTFIFPDKK